MNNKEKLEMAHWAVAQAKKHGADEVAISISNSRDIEIEYRDKKIETLKESSQNSLSLTIYTDHKFSNHTTNDIRKESLAPFISEAVAMTKYLSSDQFRELGNPKFYEGRSTADLKLRDPNYESMTSKKRVEVARQIEDAAQSVSDKIISCTGGYGDTYSESIKVLSNGFEGERTTTVFYAGSQATIDDGNGGRPQDWYYGVTRNFDDLPKTAMLGRSAVERALRKVGQTKIASGEYDMIVENRTVSRLLSALYGPMRARSLQQRSSFLEGKLGEKIASDKLTMIDDPFVPSGMGSRHYDGDGFSARKRTIIDKGVLKEYFVDNYYGKKLGMEPNSGGTSNVVLESGSKSVDEMIASVDKGIYVTGFLGGNSNSTTGDFSYGIVGQLIEGGKIIKSVNEMNISGFLVDLWQGLGEVGNDPYIYSSWRLPTLKFNGVQFSGV